MARSIFSREAKIIVLPILIPPDPPSVPETTLRPITFNSNIDTIIPVDDYSDEYKDESSEDTSIFLNTNNEDSDPDLVQPEVEVPDEDNEVVKFDAEENDKDLNSMNQNYVDLEDYDIDSYNSNVDDIGNSNYHIGHLF